MIDLCRDANEVCFVVRSPKLRAEENGMISRWRCPNGDAGIDTPSLAQIMCRCSKQYDTTPCSLRLSIPTQRVLGHDRGRDLLPAGTAATAATTSRRPSVVVVVGTHTPLAHTSAHESCTGSWVRSSMGHDRTAVHAGTPQV